MRRQVRFLVFAVTCVTVGYLLWHMYRLPFVELEKELQSVKAAGEPMRYEDTAPPIPPSSDAATVYRKAINLLPKFSEIEQRAFDDFLAGRQVDKTRVRRILKRCRNALMLAKQASRHPHSRWIKWQPDPYSVQFPHLSQIRSIIRLLKAEALLRLQDDDINGALGNCVILLRIAQHLWDEPFGIHATHGLFVFKTVNDITQRVYDSKGIPPTWARRLMRLVSQWDGDQALIRWLQLERVIHLQFFNRLRASPKLAWEFTLIWSEGCQIYSGGNIAGWMQPISRQLAINELLILRFDRQLLEIARKGEPYNWEEFKQLDEAAERIKTFGFAFEHPGFLRGFALRPLALAGELLSPAGLRGEENLPESAHAFEVIAKTKVYQRLLQTALALNLYRHEHSCYPATLSELVPRYLTNVPKDPFDGKQLRYHREGRGFKLWSVSDNLKDENGAPRGWLKGDICWAVGQR